MTEIFDSAQQQLLRFCKSETIKFDMLYYPVLERILKDALEKQRKRDVKIIEEVAIANRQTIFGEIPSKYIDDLVTNMRSAILKDNEISG